MNKEIWIASHITNELGVHYFKLCLDSLKTISDAKIIISYSGLICDLSYFNNIIAYQHQDKMRQFEHIKYIFSQRSELLAADDIILFLDDDDFLLQLGNKDGNKDDNTTTYQGFSVNTLEPNKGEFNYSIADPFGEIVNSEYPGFVGLQILDNYTSTGTTEVNIDTIHEFCAAGARQLIDDFSGTVIRKKYLGIFLEYHMAPYVLDYVSTDSAQRELCENISLNLLDTRFMDYIISIGGKVLSSPTVFRRLKPYASNWATCTTETKK